MVEANQRWCLPFLEVAMHRIPDLLMQGLQGVSFRVDGRADPTGPKGTILGFFHQEQDLVHPHLLLLRVWQRGSRLAESRKQWV